MCSAIKVELGFLKTASAAEACEDAWCTLSSYSEDRMRTRTAPRLTRSPSAMSRILPSWPRTCLSETTYPGNPECQWNFRIGRHHCRETQAVGAEACLLFDGLSLDPLGGLIERLIRATAGHDQHNASIAIVVLTFIPLPSRGANLQVNSNKKRAPADTEMMFPNFEPELAVDLLRALPVPCTCCW